MYEPLYLTPGVGGIVTVPLLPFYKYRFGIK